MRQVKEYHYLISTKDVFNYLTTNNITPSEFSNWKLVEHNEDGSDWQLVKRNEDGEKDVKLMYKDITILSDGEVLGIYPYGATEYRRDILVRNEYTGYYWDMPRDIVNLLLEHGAYTDKPENIPSF